MQPGGRAWWRWTIPGGGALVLVAAFLHPPTFDPTAAEPVWLAAATAPRAWMADHVLVAFGLGIWTLGLLHWVWMVLPPSSTMSWRAWIAAALTTALSLWLTALTVELTSLPLTAAVDQVPAWFAGLWPAVLGLGYLGAVLQWLALALVAAALRARHDPPSRRLGFWGLLSVPPGWAAMIAAWYVPAWATWLLAIGLAPATAWLLLTVFRLPSSPH
ncbi:MAG TPA: hypothetical protein VF282_04335 [Bacillota bacterium]